MNLIENQIYLEFLWPCPRSRSPILSQLWPIIVVNILFYERSKVTCQLFPILENDTFYGANDSGIQSVWLQIILEGTQKKVIRPIVT